MRRLHLALLSACVAIALTSALHAQTAPNPVTPTSAIKLFDGKSLENFDTWLVDHHESDPERVFSVVDQIDGAPAIRISGQFWGGLLTKQAYRDYRLIVEYRWGGVTWGERKTRTRDSGVLIHAQGRPGNTRKDFNGPWLRSLEFQIIEGGVGDFISVSGFAEIGEQIRPSMTFRVRKDRDGEDVYDPKGEPKVVIVWPRELVGTQRGLGRIKSRVSRTRRMSRARDWSGRGSKRSSRRATCSTSSTESW